MFFCRFSWEDSIAIDAASEPDVDDALLPLVVPTSWSCLARFNRLLRVVEEGVILLAAAPVATCSSNQNGRYPAARLSLRKPAASQVAYSQPKQQRHDPAGHTAS